MSCVWLILLLQGFGLLEIQRKLCRNFYTAGVFQCIIYLSSGEIVRISKRYVASSGSSCQALSGDVTGSAIVFLVLYVDDILLMGNDISILQSVKI